MRRKHCASGVSSGRVVGYQSKIRESSVPSTLSALILVASRASNLGCVSVAMTTCCSVLGVIGLVLTDLAIIISFATPYWIQARANLNQGLWAFCRSDSCSWFFEENYITEVETDVGWWIAVQGMISVGLGIGILCLLVATIALCCECRGCNTSQCIGVLLLLAFLSLGVGAVVFGVCAHKFEDVELEWTLTHGKKFGWAFWLDTVAAGMALLTGLIYLVDGSSRKV
ncbi:hypothetical protein PoB_003683800 [Plakobranchus ocellatus]|uniref:Uncharacterized protein n=1 Tax=Plakobranchus ocellatus TaxID=259542 RepID=A0AAV4AUU7_9GAST|nr:hypothetical protein PoB_003683800 [Plakobranchus ocellatus]